MTSSLSQRITALPTAAKLILFLTAALLPLGLALMWLANSGIRQANRAIIENAEGQSVNAGRAIDSLIARNALALRIAANGAFRDSPTDPCASAASTLAIVPGVVRRFNLSSQAGLPLCTVGDLGESGNPPLVAPADIALWIAPDGESLDFRVGVIGGMASGTLSGEELRAAAQAASDDIQMLVLSDGRTELPVIARIGNPMPSEQVHVSTRQLGRGRLMVRAETHVPAINTSERLLILLPVLMWIIAGMISWLLVHRLLIRPLRKLQLAIGDFQPGGEPLVLPARLGPAIEIQALGNAFVRAGERIEESEQQMSDALDGQRKLVREVHHRVKNNLQVIASLLNIHGRNVETPDAKAAYAAISRRVDALAVVHRNHFAELEDDRGIALRPLLTELAASLRASAPDSARKMSIELELDNCSTTQDVAVAVGFLITEVVEFAMLKSPEEGIEVTLRRASELTARLSVCCAVLAPENEKDTAQIQFERIVAGLARQLRSPLDRKLGRYSVDLPIFPPR